MDKICCLVKGKLLEIPDYDPDFKGEIYYAYDEFIKIPQDVLESVRAQVKEARIALSSLRLLASRDREGQKNNVLEGFFSDLEARLAANWEEVLKVNAKDVSQAMLAGRAITRLQLTTDHLSSFQESLRFIAASYAANENLLSEIQHAANFTIELCKVPLGVVGFVFEARPNVVIDALGLLAAGNSVVFRVGRDAYETVRTILNKVVYPSLEKYDIPCSVLQVTSPEREAGYALFSSSDLALAVARGSGSAVNQLVSVAEASGVPYSAHGRGGAWMVISDTFEGPITQIVADSLDRKVCNTLNTIVFKKLNEDKLRLVLDGVVIATKVRRMDQEGLKGQVHLFGIIDQFSKILREYSEELDFYLIEESALKDEYEWDNAPELALVAAPSTEVAFELYSNYSSRFVLSLLSNQKEDWARAKVLECPFLCDGFTRWVDGQYALSKPELGLSNWERGRLMARGGILSGDGVFSVQAVATGLQRALPRR